MQSIWTISTNYSCSLYHGICTVCLHIQSVTDFFLLHMHTASVKYYFSFSMISLCTLSPFLLACCCCGILPSAAHYRYICFSCTLITEMSTLYFLTFDTDLVDLAPTFLSSYGRNNRAQFMLISKDKNVKG